MKVSRQEGLLAVLGGLGRIRGCIGSVSVTPCHTKCCGFAQNKYVARKEKPQCLVEHWGQVSPGSDYLGSNTAFAVNTLVERVVTDVASEGDLLLRGNRLELLHG